MAQLFNKLFQNPSLADIEALLVPRDEPEGAPLKIKDGKTFKTNFSISVGNVEDYPCGFNLSYQKEATGTHSPPSKSWRI